MDPWSSLPHSKVLPTCAYPKPHQSIPCRTSHFPNIHFNIILPSTLSLPICLFVQVFQPNPVYTSPLPHTHYMPCPSHSSQFYHLQNIGWGVKISELVSIQFSSFSCHLVPLRPKYSLQQPTFKHAQPTLLSKCERPSFTPIKNRIIYSSVYFTLSPCISFH